MDKIRGSIKYDYYKGGDVLYAFINKPRPAKSIDLGNGIVLRADVRSNKLVGFTIVDFKRRVRDGLLTNIPYFEEISISSINV